MLRMYEQLKKSLDEKVSLTDAEWESFRHSFIPKKMRRRQFLLQEGDVCTRLVFIEKGGLYSYSIDAKGNQRVLQFGFEGFWIADLYSFFTGEASNISIEVLEDCELLMLERSQHDKLLKTIPAYNDYVRILYQNAYVALQLRVENALGLTAEERYSRFLGQYSKLMNRVPLHLIASYLGISAETLSRVRSKMAG